MDTNPAETRIGRARRIAMLMLGFYKSADISEVLGKLSTDSSSSLYATRSLVKLSTIAAMKALAGAFKDAKGWAKGDVIDAFATLNLARFYEIMLINGLDHANGLESYLAVPLFRTLPIENYLRGGNNIPPRLSQQAALVVNQILQDSMSYAGNNSLPLIFERNLPTLTRALFLIIKRSEEHTSELQSRLHLVCRLLLEKKKPGTTPLHACDIISCDLFSFFFF